MQARETLRVIMERQKKQREEMIMQITRVMDKTRGILKTCDAGLHQLVASLAPIDEGQETMDTSDANKVELSCHAQGNFYGCLFLQIL